MIGLFFLCLLLLSFGRTETYLGKVGLAFCRLIFPHTPFHFLSFFLSGESTMPRWKWDEPWLGPLLSPSLSAAAELPGLSSLPSQCWVIFQGCNLSNIPELMENVGEVILVGGSFSHWLSVKSEQRASLTENNVTHCLQHQCTSRCLPILCDTYH